MCKQCKRIELQHEFWRKYGSPKWVDKWKEYQKAKRSGDKIKPKKGGEN